MITPEQCRAARAWLLIGQQELADLAGVSKSMLKDFESAKRMPTRNNLASLARALQEQGMVFTSEPGLLTVGVKIDQ